MTTFTKHILIGVVISIPAYFISNFFIQRPGTIIFGDSGYNSLINALLVWVVVGLFGLLDIKEKQKTAVSSYLGVGILLSGFVLFISNTQLGGTENNFTVILLCFVITPIYGLMELVAKENEKTQK